MAQVVISREDLYPVGTVVDAYRAAGPTPVSGRPPYGPSAGSATVDANGLLTYASLTENAPFILYAPAPDRYLRIFVSSTAVQDTSVGGLASFDLIEDVDTGWPARPDGAQSGTWIGWTDPTALMHEYDRFIPIPAPS
jgi:hypothetical protein